jgi:hypothetical protein
MSMRGFRPLASEGNHSSRESHRHRDTPLVERNDEQAHSMSALLLAATSIESLVLQLHRHAGAAVRELRDDLEHVRYTRALSGVRPSMAMDDLFALRRCVTARGLVRGDRRSRIDMTDDDTVREQERSQADEEGS